jgi:drug/metabolite transporter (DMT)-like permease
LSFQALFLVLSSALLHALWNALLKREADISTATVCVLTVSLVSSALLVPWFPGPRFPTRESLLWGLGSGVFEGIYFLTLAMALLRAPLGFAYTVARGTAIALVFPISVLLLGEHLTWLSGLGVVVLYAGLIAVGLSREQQAGRQGLLWSCVCGGCVAGYHLCYKQALQAGALAPALFTLSLSVALPINLLHHGRGAPQRVLRALRDNPRRLILAGVACTASFTVFLYALALAGAGAVLTLRNTSVIFAQLLSLSIGERLRAPQVIGALLIGVGAALIGWPS